MSDMHEQFGNRYEDGPSELSRVVMCKAVQINFLGTQNPTSIVTFVILDISHVKC